jgi:MFS family permease
MPTNTPSKHMITIFAFSTGLFWFSLYAYVPELSTYAESLGASYKLIGLITGSYGLTQLLLRIPLGIVSDLLGRRKPFILMGLVVAIISSLITFINPSASSLLITRLLAGVSAATWVVFTVLFSGYFHEKEATKSVGYINSYNALGQLTSMILGGIISWRFGPRYLFLLALIGALIGFVIALFITEVNHNKRPFNLTNYLQVAKNPMLLRVSGLAILSQLITFATAFGFVPVLAKNMGAVNIQLSLLTILAILPAIFISRLAGDLFPRLWGIKKTLMIGSLISAFLCILMPLIPNLTGLYIAQFFSGVGRSMVFPLLMGLGIQNVPGHNRASAMGLFQAIYGIGMVLGPILLGFIGDTFGLVVGFMFTGLIGFVSLAIIAQLDE